MAFADRINIAIIELDLDQEILFKLPPVSEGRVEVSLTHSQPDLDLSGIPVHFSAPPRYGGVTVHRTGIQPVAIKAQDDNGGGGIVGDIGPARDLQVYLMHSNHLSVSHPHTVVATSQWTDDLWRLRIKRIQDTVSPSTERRRYKVVVSYNSLLPIVERRIPVSFFQNGFDENWNKEQYVHVHVSGSRIKIGFRPDLAALYSLDDYEIPLDDMVDFRDIFSEKIQIGAGVGPVVVNPQGETQNSIFISVRVDLHGGEMKLNLSETGGFEYDFITIPSSTIFFRFYIVSPSLRYVPIADFSDLFTKISTVNNSTKAAIAIKKVNDKINEKMREFESKQYVSDNGGTYSKFGRFLAPWFMGGDYEFRSVDYAPGTGDVFGSGGIVQPATGNLVVKYVGPRIPEPPVIIIPDDDIDDGSIDLFLVPFEINFPITARRPTGFNPIVPRPGSMEWLRKIDHIIVLMQENRSFDHVLGYLSRDGLREYLRVNDLTENEMVNNKVIGLAPEGHPDYDDQFNEYATLRFFPKKANVEEPPRTSVTGWAGSTDNPAHGIQDVSMQIDGGSMKGFVKNYAHRIRLSPNQPQPVGGLPELRNVMNYFGSEHLPIYAEIAKHFGICDRWYSAFAGGTLPNRYLTVTGRLNLDRFGQPEEANPDAHSMTPSELPTIFEYLELYGKKWRVYEHGYSFTRLFGKHTFDTTNILPFNDPVVGFEAAAKAGNLPEFTYIEPNYIELPPGNDDHAPADMKDGQTLVERIVRAVVNSPKWFKTLLIITYDEHGGFYDHVPPPINYPPIGGNTATLGVRVPTLVVSPLIKPGSVFHRRFDHTTIGATVLRRFCSPNHPPLLSMRMDSAYDLSEILELADAPSPRTDFGIFGGSVVGPADSTNSNFSAPRSFTTDDPTNDFHWVLAITRLITGQELGLRE